MLFTPGQKLIYSRQYCLPLTVKIDFPQKETPHKLVFRLNKKNQFTRERKRVETFLFPNNIQRNSTLS